MGNAVKEVVGEDKLKIYKLRQNSVAKMHVASCCGALIAVDHPEPGPHAIPIPANANRIVCDDETIGKGHPTTVARVFTCDWDKRKHPDAIDLPPYAGPNHATKAALMTSGFAFKFISRTKAGVKMAGDRSLADIEKAVCNSQPTIIGAD